MRTPAVTSPAAGAVDVSRTPTIIANGFGSVYGVAHAASQFQVSTDNTFTAIDHDSGTLGAVTSWVLTGGPLVQSTACHARARYRDADGVWSSWSATVSFTTTATMITTPSVTSPSNGATNISRTPTFTSSAFAMTSGADTHAASQWQVSTVSDFSTTVIDTGDDAANKTSYTAGAALAGGTTHYVRVRHKGALGEYSAWSPAASLMTWTFGQWLMRIDRPTTVTTNALEYFARVLVDGAGSIYAVGTDRSYQSGANVYPAGYILKSNADGTTLWERRYAHATTAQQSAYTSEFHAAVLDGSGNLYCVGVSYDGYVNNLTVVKYDGNGNMLAHKCYQGTTINTVNDAVYDGSGDIYVVCKDTANRNLLLKIGTSLALQWAVQYVAGGTNLRGVAYNPAGYVYVCGDKDGNLFVARFDTSGAFQSPLLGPSLSGWTMRFNQCVWGSGYLRCVGTMTNGSTTRAVAWSFDATLNTQAYKYSSNLANAQCVIKESGGASWVGGYKMVTGYKAGFIMRNDSADVDRTLRDADDEFEIYGITLDNSGNVIFGGMYQLDAGVAMPILGTMAAAGGNTGIVANLPELSWMDDGSSFDGDFSGHGWGVDTTNYFSSFTGFTVATPYQSSLAVTRAKTLAPY